MKAIDIFYFLFLCTLCSCQSNKQEAEQVSAIDSTSQARNELLQICDILDY